MKTLNVFKKATLVIALFLSVITLTSCGKKTSSYEGISDTKVYASAGKYTVTEKELYDLLKYQKNGFTFTSSSSLDELKEELIFSPWTSLVDFKVTGDDLRDAAEEDLTQYEKDVRDLVNNAVYGTTEQEEIDELTEKQAHNARVQFLDSFVSEGINVDNIFDKKILDTFKLEVAQKSYARALLTESVNKEFLDDKEEKENSEYISAKDIEEYYEDNYENKNPLDALLIKFNSKNEADQTLKLFGNLEIEGKHYRGLKSYKNRLYLIPEVFNEDGSELTQDKFNDYYSDYTVTANDQALDDLMLQDETTGDYIQESKGLYVLVEFVKMYQYMYGYKSEVTDADIDALLETKNLEEAVKLVKAYDDNKANYEYEELTEINTSLRSYLYTTLVAQPEEGSAISYRYSSSPRSYGSSYYLMYKLTDQEKVKYEDIVADEEQYEKIYNEIKQEIFEEMLTDSYVSNCVSEVLELATLKIFDPEMELIYTLNNSSFKKSKDKSTKFIAKVTVKADEDIHVEKNTYEITPVDFFNKLAEVAGPSFAFNHLAEKALLDSEYVNKVTADDKQEFKENFKAVVDSFSNNYFASYGLPASMGRKNFIKLYFNADSIQEALDNFYLTSKVIELYLEDIHAHYGEDTLKTLQSFSKKYYDLYYSASANHFLTYLDIDEDGNPDDPQDYLDTLSAEKQAEFKELVYEFNLKVYEEASKTNDAHYTTFGNIISQFEESTRIVPSAETCKREPSLVDCKWAKYKKAGLYVKTEDLSTIDNTTSLNYDEAFIAKFEEMLNSQNLVINGQYMQPLGTSYDDLLTSTFGWHIIVLTNSTKQVSTRYLESDDINEAYKEVVYFEKGKETVTLNAYNPNNYPSLNQIDIYLRERNYSNGIENLPASVKSAMETTFKPVMDLFDSNENKLFLLRSYLLTVNAESLDGVTFEDATLNNVLHDTFKVTVKSVIGYEYLENIAKNPLGDWFEVLYNFEH